MGTAFQDGPVPAQWADAAAQLPELSERVPSQEVVLEASPDLVFAGWESNFSPEGAGARADLDAMGVNTYVAPSACQSAGQPAKLTFDHIFADLQELGIDLLAATDSLERDGVELFVKPYRDLLGVIDGSLNAGKAVAQGD